MDKYRYYLKDEEDGLKHYVRTHDTYAEAHLSGDLVFFRKDGRLLGKNLFLAEMKYGDGGVLLEEPLREPREDYYIGDFPDDSVRKVFR